MNKMRFVLVWLLVVTAAIIPVRARAQDGRVIRPNVTTSGSVVVFNGNLEVYGTVRGNATALKGDVIVHRGGRVRGDAIALAGTVRMQGGTVNGRVKTYGRDARTVRFHRRTNAGHSTMHSVGLATGWIIVVALVGFALLAFGADKLAIVIDTMRQGVGKSPRQRPARTACDRSGCGSSGSASDGKSHRDPAHSARTGGVHVPRRRDRNVRLRCRRYDDWGGYHRRSEP